VELAKESIIGNTVRSESSCALRLSDGDLVASIEVAVTVLYR
jgi:hypothetical protein